MKIPFPITSIRSRIIFFSCIVTFCILLILSSTIYIRFYNNLKNDGIKKITAIRDLKMQEINTWLSRIMGDMHSISKSNIIALTGYKLCNFKPVSVSEREALSSFFDSYLNNYNVYYELFIVSSINGKIVYSTIHDNIGADRSKNIYLTETLRNGDIFIKDIYYSSNLNVPTMTLSVPIQSPRMMGQKTAGVFVARIYLERSLYNLLLNRTGLGKTGESIIINEDMVALSKLLVYDSFPLTKRLKDDATLLAIQGKTGDIICKDYAGKTVITAYSYIKKLNWGFIVKQDVDEILSPLDDLLISLLLFTLLSLAVVFIMSYRFSRNITEPISSIVQISSKIKGGDFNIRINYDVNDEFKELSESFNSMADLIISQLNIQRKSSDIIHDMVSTLNLEEFSKNVLRKFVEVTESSLGAFYMLSQDGREFKHVTSIGLDTDSIESFHAGRLEGEFGKALATREIAVTRNISGNTVLKLRTTVGDMAPAEIMTIPIIVNNKTVAIISLASMGTYPERILKVLNQVRPVMNTAFSNIISDEETRRLAKELSEKNQLLVSQKDALVTQAAALTEQTEKVKKQNKELESQRKKVEEANKLKSEFLSNMSHELRTPLNSILALSHVLMLQTKEKINDEEMGYLNVIDRNGNKLLTLINDILDLSKIESGRIDLKIRRLSLVNMVATIVDNLEQIAVGKGIGLKMIVQGDISEIESDESRVYQICQNIIQNAVKFTERGGVSITISQENDVVRLTVEDTGIGISEKELPHIFEEFRQLDGTLSRKYDGTGLGLTIAAKSAMLISAMINVRSKVEKGSCFDVVFPVKWRKYEEKMYHENDRDNTIDNDLSYAINIITTNDEEKIKKPKKTHGDKATILVVDDDKDNILAVKAILNDKYEIIEAYDGNKALEIAFNAIPDLVLLDMALPGKSGFLVAKEMKDDITTNNIPIIALTALTMTGDKERIIEAGCNDYIPKPVHIQTLLKKIENWLLKNGHNTGN